MGKVAVTPLREVGGWWLWVARRRLFFWDIHFSTAEPFSPPLFLASKYSQDTISCMDKVVVVTLTKLAVGGSGQPLTRSSRVVGPGLTKELLKRA